MAMSNPGMHNLPAAYRSMYEALGVKDIDSLMPPVPEASPMDPSVEHINVLSGKAIKAFLIKTTQRT